MTSELISRHLCMTRDVGVQGNLFGGILLSWLDEAGAIFAMESVGSRNLVTLKVGELVFTKSVKVHDVIFIYGEVARRGRTSITVHLEARVHDVETDEQERVCTVDMIFVRINEHGVPSPLTE